MVSSTAPPSTNPFQAVLGLSVSGREASAQKMPTKKRLCVYVGLGKGDSLPHWMNLVDKIIGFEADVENYAYIKTKSDPSIFRDRLELLNVAADKKYGNKLLHRSEDGVSNSFYPIKDEKDSVEVRTMNICDYLWNLRRLSFIDYFILDTNGHDFVILKSMEPYLIHKRIGSIYIKTTVAKTKKFLKYEALTQNYKLIQSPDDDLEAGLMWEKKPNPFSSSS